MKPRNRVVTSYKNLSEELVEALKKKYPTGLYDHMIRIDKGNGDFFYAVVLDTEETSYLVKIDVKIDDLSDEDDDKDYFSDDIEGADELADEDDEE
ncbi:MAG: hypothetical protein R3Y51_01685 [Rikenellaceae bacterium]